VSEDDRITLAALRRQSEHALNLLGLPPRFTFTQLHERLEERRGREIHLIPQRLPALAPHGLWVAGESADYIFYEASAGRLRQQLIVGHEYGHMLFDDTSTPADIRELSTLLSPHPDPILPRNIQARRTYEQPRERRAEVFSTIAVGRAGSWSTISTPVRMDPQLAARFVTALEGNRDPWEA
jgi:hypothetical protein